MNVKGKTELIGGAITSTQAAVEQERNRFNSEGGVVLSDIHNNASFEASSVSVSGGTSGGNTGAGVGSTSGSTSSTTTAAISGIAGNKAARTDDAETGIATLFGKQRFKDEADEQVATLRAVRVSPGNAIKREWKSKMPTNSGFKSNNVWITANGGSYSCTNRINVPSRSTSAPTNPPQLSRLGR